LTQTDFGIVGTLVTLVSLYAGITEFRLRALQGKVNELTLQKNNAEIERDVERLPPDKLDAQLNQELGRK
jgi:hypothetical protein